MSTSAATPFRPIEPDMPDIKDKGFSLIELVLTITLIAILAAAATPYLFSGGSSITVDAMAGKVRDDIAYAQALAMRRHNLPTPAAVTDPTFGYRIYFNATVGGCGGTTNYSIVNDADFDDIWGEDSTESAKLPSTGADYFCVQLNTGDYSGITLTNDLIGGLIEFDAYGIPSDTGGELTVTKTVTITKSGETAQVTINAVTGMASVQ